MIFRDKEMADLGRIMELTMLHQSGAFEDDPQVNAALNKALDGIQLSDKQGQGASLGSDSPAKISEPPATSMNIENPSPMLFGNISIENLEEGELIKRADFENTASKLRKK